MEIDTIVVGDCLNVMAEMPDDSIDALILDPPFSFSSAISSGRTSIADTQFFSYWWKDVCIQLDRILKPEGEGFCWCDWRIAKIMADGFVQPQRKTLRMAQMIYHHREMPGMGRPFRSSVDMLAYLRGPKSNGGRISSGTLNWISSYWYYGKHPYHPAEKSTGLCEQLIQWCSDKDDLIFDSFIGSGTTAVAALKTGRHFYGCDISEEYVKIASERIEKTKLEMAQMSFLSGQKV